MDAWAPLLADSLAAPIAGYRLRLLEVAHGKGAPFFVKGKIKGKFAAEGRGPVLMDWGGEFAQAYGPVGDRCTVLLFDDEGRLVGAGRGGGRQSPAGGAGYDGEAAGPLIPAGRPPPVGISPLESRRGPLLMAAPPPLGTARI